MKPDHPIGVFDAGIGSYAIVERIRAKHPRQDIIYFADRSSFPYGAKTEAELLSSVKNATEYLQGEGCAAVVLASNAPSIVVLDALRSAIPVPVIGVFPPVKEAIAHSGSKCIAVLWEGGRSMVGNEAMRRYADRHRGPDGDVLLVNASPLVDLVEHFTFIHDLHQTQCLVTEFIADIRRSHPAVGVMTMSSTHLPWLKPFFASAAPDIAFLDQADTVLCEIGPYISDGQGQTRCVATETGDLPLAVLNQALRSLGSSLRAVLKS